MTLPSNAGIGLKAQHYQQLLDNTSLVRWLEIHPENYMGAGGPPHKYLTALREHYPISMHGVGMSLGSADGVNNSHLNKLAQLVDRYQPAQVSEHLAWSHWNEIFMNDLLPLPYTDEALEVMSTNIDKVQTALGQTILVENPSSYLAFKNDAYNEAEFLNLLCKRTGCDLLLDINNVFVSSQNNGFDPNNYLSTIDSGRVKEIHLAGHSIKPLVEDKTIRIDDHGSRVCEEVWSLYTNFIEQTRTPYPTLIEWDTNIPELDVLLAEANKAEQLIKDSFRFEESEQ